MKTGGHSYAGSSTAKGSVQLNLRRFPKYSRDSISQCSLHGTSAPLACKLARARGKSAVVRVGGGELWDELYRAVIDWNTQYGQFRNQQYEVIGGGAGTVSAAGGWLQGGGLSTGLERLWGFGADQVLEVEMVLADGTHVKFGPTEWNMTPGFLYPRTTKVEGFCNAHVDEDETKWHWTTCSADVPFEDLWFAVRGGGGGTYGIVTAVHYQLHDLWDLKFVWIPQQLQEELNGVLHAASAKDQVSFENMWYDFWIDFLFDPRAVNSTEDASNACGSPGAGFSLGGFAGLYCKDGAAQELSRAWAAFVRETVVRVLPVFASHSALLQRALGIVADMVTYPQFLIYSNAFNPLSPSPQRVPIGRVADNPSVNLRPDNWGCWSGAVPIDWLLQKNDDVHFYFKYILAGAHLVGGRAATAHDQMTAIPSSMRKAGFQQSIPEPYATGFRNLWRAFRQRQGQRQVDYPMDTEYNHISADRIGPLKSNWSAPCPANFTQEEQEIKCVSLQESVWGREVLGRLTNIKRLVDPKQVFNCFRCVGHATNSERVLLF